MATIITKQERERGCGFRKGGGIYLVNDGPGRGCGRIPLPLHVCPTCSQGIKPSRGFQWIETQAILAAAPVCIHAPQIVSIPEDMPTEALQSIVHALEDSQCETCPMSGRKPMRAGLMFVGGKFYPTPGDFVKEARTMGLSKRIAQIPKDLVVGETWIWLAHREAIPAAHTTIPPDGLEDCPLVNPSAEPGTECKCGAEPTPGVFHAFVPTRIEYVVKGDENESELDALEKRGLTLVKIERIGENGELFPADLPVKEDSDDN